MKQIILIDDNRDGNLSNYGGEFVKENLYKNELLYICHLSPYNDLGFLNNAACVLLHKTLTDFYDGEFHDDSHKVSSIIRDLPEMGETIPFVLFSDGDTSNRGDYSDNKPNIIYSLSKRAFYSRLRPFVETYRKTGFINLNILAYGEDYNKALISQYATKLFRRIQDYSDQDFVPISKILCTEMQRIVELGQPCLGKDYMTVVTDLQLENILVGEFKKRINIIIDNIQEYGKNYYTWE